MAPYGGTADLVWLIDKKNVQKNILQHLQETKVLSQYAFFWPFLFLGICAIIYHLTLKQKIVYKANEKKHLILGILFGFLILIIYALFDTVVPEIYIDRGKHDTLFLKTESLIKNNYINNNDIQVIVSTNPFMQTEEEKKSMGYSISSPYFHKLKREGKLSSIPLEKWLIEINEKDHIYNPKKNQSIDSLQEMNAGEMSKGSTRRVVILLTIAFIVAQWDIKIFDKVSLWIYSAIVIEAFISSLYLPYRRMRDTYIWMYVKKRLQTITACIAIVILILFSGAAKR